MQRYHERGLAELATIGSTSPFVGLFGTVWGIMHALQDIGTSGSASLDVVAGPIGEALIATAIGIATALPAVLAGIVSVNVPATTDCEPKVCTETCSFDALVSLYIVMQSKAPELVKADQETDADGVKHAVVPESAGAVAVVSAAPPAV